MSLFGKLDAASIPTNPYFIPKGEYLGKVIASEYRTNQDGTRQFYIQYVITGEVDGSDSVYNGKKPSRKYNLPDENMTNEEFKLLPAVEQQKIQNNMSSLKKDLTGSATNTAQKGLGVEMEALNDPDWDPKVLIETDVHLGITNYGQEGVNVQWVNIVV